jgi:hypothetical protein
LRRPRLHRQGRALGRRAGYARRLTPRLALAVVFIVFAAAGLSSLEGNDFCNINRGPGTSAQSSIALWPPGRDCTVTLASGRVASREAGDAAGFLAILAAGLALVIVRRRSNLALCTALMFGTTGLTSLVVSQVPAFGFGWMIGGFIGHHLTRSIPGTLTAAGALALGGFLQIVGAGPWGWAAVLLALLAVPTPYEER